LIAKSLVKKANNFEIELEDKRHRDLLNDICKKLKTHPSEMTFGKIISIDDFF
jgi:hypothetical protein